jgi:hypothetical protein
VIDLHIAPLRPRETWTSKLNKAMTLMFQMSLTSKHVLCWAAGFRPPVSFRDGNVVWVCPWVYPSVMDSFMTKTAHTHCSP